MRRIVLARLQFVWTSFSTVLNNALHASLAIGLTQWNAPQTRVDKTFLRAAGHVQCGLTTQARLEVNIF